MSTRIYCEIQNGVVVNRVLFDASGIPANWPNGAAFVENETAQIGWSYAGGVFSPPPAPPPLPPPPPSFLARDLFTQLTVADYTAIKTAIAGSDALGLLWDSLKAQGDAPIDMTSARFQQGWTGLKAALGAKRAGEIAAALNIPSG